MNGRYGLIVAALAAMAGAAAGQEREIQGDFAKPLHARALASSQASRSVTVMSTVEGDDVCEIRIEDGKITCKINGKEVPADRIKKSDGRVTILGPDGGVVKSFQVWDGADAMGGAGGGQSGVWLRQLGPREGLELRQVPPPGGVEQFGRLPPTEPPAPRVMLGITMGAAPDEFIRGHDFKPEDVFLIDRVIDGLAADRAGLRKGDVVIEIDGQRPASPERLREIMRAKEPEDTIRLKVFRDGDDQELAVRLMEYDASRLGASAVPTPDAPQWQTFGLGVAPGEIEGAVREAIEEALRSLRSDDAEEAVREARRILEQSLKEFEREGEAVIRRFQRDFGGGGGGRFFFGNQPDMVFQVPAPPEPPAAVEVMPPVGEHARAAREETDRLREEVERMRRDLADIKAMLKEMQKSQGR